MRGLCAGAFAVEVKLSGRNDVFFRYHATLSQCFRHDSGSKGVGISEGIRDIV